MTSTTNPWADLPDKPPYIHPQDAAVIGRCNASLKPEHKIRPECLPEPFLGDPSAPVLFLLRNPGFHPDDVGAYAWQPFHSASRANLLHAGGDYPFYLLSPRFAHLPGGRWWRTRLGYLARRMRTLLTLPDLEHAWRVLARNVAGVEYHGYHSKEYHPLDQNLFTQTYGFGLVKAAVERSAVIVVFRSLEDWEAAVPALRDYEFLYKLNSPQNVCLTPANCPSGWATVLARMLVNEGVRGFTPGPEDEPRRHHRRSSRVPPGGSGEPDCRDPGVTLGLLDILESKYEFSDDEFRMLHHLGHRASINNQRRYCAEVKRFVDGNNVILTRRLASCVDSRSNGVTWETAIARARETHPFLAKNARI